MSEIVEIGQQVEIAKLSYSPTEPNWTECVPIFQVVSMVPLTECENMNHKYGECASTLLKANKIYKENSEQIQRKN